MFRHKPSALWSVFFCSLGSVCAGPASQAIAQTNNPVEPMTGQEEPINLFDEDQDSNLPNGQSVNVGSFGEIDLHVKDLELTKVLQLLSIQSERNIIASRNVAGTVSADLYNVDFYDALDAILTANGFGYTEKGDFIYVYTAEEIQALEEANRQVVTRVYRLNYLTAADAATLVTPMLSDAGQIGVTGAPSAGFQPSLSSGGENSFANEATLVIRDYPENVDEILLVLDDLDTRPRQVLIESTILRAALEENNAFGVDFSIVADVDLADFVSPLNVVDELVSGSAGNSGTAIESGVGSNVVDSSGFSIGVLGSNVSAFVQALDRIMDTTVLARPKMLVLNRQRGELLIGTREPYLSTTTTETSSTQTVEFLDTGVSLAVRPFISKDDYVRMELRPSLSSAQEGLISGVTAPGESVQEIVTNVIVKTGQTLVLGGLFQEETIVNREQVPGVGDVPLLGAAFKGQSDAVTRQEIIFMIKPTIMKDSLMADAVDQVEEGITAARIGARNQLLPWSRSKWTSSLLKQAYQARAAGDDKKAMWYTNLVLNNEPSNQEAVELKADLNGQSMMIYDRGLLEQATDTAIDGAVDIRNPVEDTSLEPGTLDDPVIPWSMNDTPADQAEPVADAGFEPATPAKVTKPGITNAEPYALPDAGLTDADDAEVLYPAAVETVDAQPEAETTLDATAEAADAVAFDNEIAEVETIEPAVEVFGSDEEATGDESWALESIEEMTNDASADAATESEEEIAEFDGIEPDAYDAEPMDTEPADTTAEVETPVDEVSSWFDEIDLSPANADDAQAQAEPVTDDVEFDENDVEYIDAVDTVTEVPTDTE